MAEGPKRGPQGAYIEAPVGDGAEVSRLNLIELVPALQMPVLLFLGVVRITGFRQRPEHCAFRGTEGTLEEARLVRALRP